MNYLGVTYDLQEVESDGDIWYFFISKGKVNIIKAIEYTFVKELDDRRIYNLTFGDYDLRNDVINDDVNSNNGDAYKVFNTVLSTVSTFFEINREWHANGSW